MVTGVQTCALPILSYMFRGCSGLTSLDLSSFKTANVTNMSYMFKDCSDLTSLDLSSFNTAKVTNMYEMFANCSKLTSLNVSKFNTANVTYMGYMFKDCSDLTSLDLSNFNTDNVTTMYEMFANCSKLTSLDVSKFNTANVTNMEHMFYNCSTLTSLDVSNFNTAKVKNMNSMFYKCSTLESLNVSKFNTANVTDMRYMFYNCSGLTSLDVSNFNTDNVRDMSYMFYKCSGLTTIYVSDDFKIGNNTDGLDMFFNCSKLVGAVSYNSGKTGIDMANFDGYFKTYYKLGNDQVDLYGDKFAVESLTLSDDKNFVAHAPFKANLVSYTREITSTSKWYTLCLPFAYNTTPQNFTAYKLKSATDNSVEIEEMTGEIDAGTPIIFKFKDGANKNIDISVSNADIKNDPGMASTTENDCQLYGTYQEKTFSLQDGNTFIIYKDRLMNPANMPQSVTKVGVKPFRAYMTMTSHAGTSAKSFSIGSGDEGTTAIDLLNSVATDDAEYYDINGRRIDAPAKGLNIVRRGNKTMKLIIK